MINQKIRDAIVSINAEALVFDNQAYDASIIGMSDNRVVYDYDLMIQELAQEDEISFEEAQEWIDYNTIRSLGYYPNSPIVAIQDEETGKYFDLAREWCDEDEVEDYPELEV